MIEFEYIDHIAYVFKSIDSGYDFFKSHPGFVVHNGPGINHVQGVKFLFISITGVNKIEILSPISSSSPSPISEQISKTGPGFNHICYAVINISDSIQKLVESGWKVICNPVADPAFYGRRIAFLFHRDVGLIELVESQISNNIYPTISDQSISNLPHSSAKPIEDSTQLLQAESFQTVPIQILQLINNAIEGPDLQTVSSFNDIDEWDSLSSAIFHASYEQLIGSKLNPNDFNSLACYLDHYVKSGMT